MSPTFHIKSSEPELLKKANEVARRFANQYKRPEVVGIVFLGAIARGYFDSLADIDIAIFKKQAARLPLQGKFFHVDGFEVQVWLSDYESELDAPWDMSRRWTYIHSQIYYDPEGKIARLVQAKVTLQAEERKWLMMSGLALSEWYINGLTDLWLQRGNIVNAHHMLNQGLDYFFELLFGLNNELVADMKWRYYCAEQLERLPSHFQERTREAMTLHDFTVADLQRRKHAFMLMWDEMCPQVEKEVGLSFKEINNLV